MQQPTNSISFETLLYEGDYGSELGKKVHKCQLSVPIGSSEPKPTPCRVVCVVDRSGSMAEVMPTVKVSMEFLCAELAKASSSGETEFGLFTFSIGAETVIPITPVNEELPSQITPKLKEIEACGPTNLHAGLQLALDGIRDANKKKLLPTFIVVLTDGHANSGEIQTQDKFRDYMESQRLDNIHVYSLGFGSSYNPQTLQSIGQYTHIKSETDIPEIMGSLLSEVVNAVGMRARLSLSMSRKVGIVSSTYNPSDPTLIPLGLLYRGRKFTFLATVEEDSQLVALLEYFSVSDSGVNPTKEVLVLNTVSQPAGEPTLEVKRLFFDLTKTHILAKYMDLLASNTTEAAKYQETIDKTVLSWVGKNDSVASEYATKLAVEAKGLRERNLQTMSNAFGSSQQTNLDPNENANSSEDARLLRGGYVRQGTKYYKARVAEYK